MDLITLAAVIVVAIVVIAIAYVLLKLTVKVAVSLIMNALGGLLILLLSNIVLGMGIPYDFPTLLISAIAGVPGAVCIIILALLGIYL